MITLFFGVLFYSFLLVCSVYASYSVNGERVALDSVVIVALITQIDLIITFFLETNEYPFSLRLSKSKQTQFLVWHGDTQKERRVIILYIYICTMNNSRVLLVAVLSFSIFIDKATNCFNYSEHVVQSSKYIPKQRNTHTQPFCEQTREIRSIRCNV